MTPRLPELSAEDILAALNARGVRYLVIGAFSAIAQGAPIEATYDVDLTPQRDPENLERLSLALDDLQARVRVDQLDEGLPFSHDARSLAGIDMLNLTCPAGDFDLVFAPAGYDELAPRSVMITVSDQTCARQAWATSCTPKKKPAARKTYEPCLFSADSCATIQTTVSVLTAPRIHDVGPINYSSSWRQRTESALGTIRRPAELARPRLHRRPLDGRDPVRIR